MGIAVIIFPIFALLMFWDIMRRLNRIWEKLSEMDARQRSGPSVDLNG